MQRSILREKGNYILKNLASIWFPVIKYSSFVVPQCFAWLPHYIGLYLQLSDLFIIIQLQTICSGIFSLTFLLFDFLIQLIFDLLSSISHSSSDFCHSPRGG